MSFLHRQNKKKKVKHPTMKLHNEIIKLKNNTHFLGLWMDVNLKWSTHTNHWVKNKVRSVLLQGETKKSCI